MDKREKKEFEALRSLRFAVESYIIYRDDEGLPYEYEAIGRIAEEVIYQMLKDRLGETLFDAAKIKAWLDEGITFPKIKEL